jgi:hypothetical protein
MNQVRRSPPDWSMRDAGLAFNAAAGAMAEESGSQNP